MDVYFAGSIRGGRAYASRFAEAIRFFREQGFHVLTEHVGAADLKDMGETGLSDGEIFARDMAWLAASDAVVADCSCPSLGVGYEIRAALEMGKPVFALYCTEAGSLSAMIAGDARVRVFPYAEEGSLFNALKEIIKILRS